MSPRVRTDTFFLFFKRTRLVPTLKFFYFTPYVLLHNLRSHPTSTGYGPFTPYIHGLRTLHTLRPRATFPSRATFCFTGYVGKTVNTPKTPKNMFLSTFFTFNQHSQVVNFILFVGSRSDPFPPGFFLPHLFFATLIVSKRLQIFSRLTTVCKLCPLCGVAKRPITAVQGLLWT